MTTEGLDLQYLRQLAEAKSTRIASIRTQAQKALAIPIYADNKKAVREKRARVVRKLTSEIKAIQATARDIPAMKRAVVATDKLLTNLADDPNDALLQISSWAHNYFDA